MKIFFDSSTETAPVVVNGNPPVDQSAQVATLTQQVADLTAVLTGVKARAQARKDADTAKVDGQDDLDALAAAGI